VNPGDERTLASRVGFVDQRPQGLGWTLLLPMTAVFRRIYKSKLLARLQRRRKRLAGRDRPLDPGRATAWTDDLVLARSRGPLAGLVILGHGNVPLRRRRAEGSLPVTMANETRL